MKTIATTLLALLSLSVHAEEKFPIRSGNGITIQSPIDKSVVRPDDASVAYIRDQLDDEVTRLERDYGAAVRERWGWA